MHGEVGKREAELDASLTAAARRLAELPLAEQSRPTDSRFAEMLRAVDGQASTAAELAGRLLRRRRDPPDSAYVAKQLERLAEVIASMPELTLEQELTQIFAPAPNERNGQILISYHGWKDGRPRTLTEVGTQFRITRERVRQICAKLTRRHDAVASMPAPVMDRALALILPQLPVGVDYLEKQLADQGLTAVGLPLQSVIAGAKLLGRSPGFEITRLGPGKESNHALAVRCQQVDAALDIVDVAKKEIYFHGLATVTRIRSLVSQRHSARVTNDLVKQSLQRIDGFCWLDRRGDWFRLLPISRHGLPKMIEKILAVAGEVTVGQMRTAVGRNRRFWKDPPPEQVLLEFCRHTPGVRVEGQRILADPPLDWRKVLTGVEAQLVEVLESRGPVMDRGQMEDLCTAQGMNRFSFHAFVSWSPVIAQVDHSIYSLLGTKVPRAEVDRLVDARRAKRLSHRVLDSHGWTLDGKVWLSYRLSKAASTYAVITVPAALKDVVQGSFALLGPDQRKIGTLATRDGRAWGLGAFLRQHHAQIGDQVVVTLDLRHRTAQVEIREDAAP